MAAACAPAATPRVSAAPPASDLAAAPGIPPAQPGDTLRHAGIYQSRELASPYASNPGPLWSYLRFYPDSFVVVTSTYGEPHELSNLWIGNTLLPFGSVSVRGNRFSFTTRDFSPDLNVTVEYDGYVQGDRLYMQTFSDYNNGVRGSEVYTFVPMDAKRLDGVQAQPRPR